MPYSRKGEALLLSSFRHLADLCGFAMMDVSAMVFPLNIAALYGQAAEALAQKDREIELLLVEDGGRIRLATAKEASTETTLFHLPVYPLWKCMRDKMRRQETNLLLSVFAYLHQIAGIGFFNGWTYIGSKYECLLEWLSEDDGWEDNEEHRRSLSTVKAAIHFGERMHRKVRHPYHLNAWEDRLRNFQRGDAVSVTLWDIADRLFALYGEYPSRSLNDNVRPELLRPNEEYRMGMEQVFAFIWDEDGWLGNQLRETVSAELNECCAADEPLALQFFDTPQKEAKHDLGFETRLYDLLHDLSDLLRQL